MSWADIEYITQPLMQSPTDAVAWKLLALLPWLLMQRPATRSTQWISNFSQPGASRESPHGKMWTQHSRTFAPSWMHCS
eukprot:m.186304 g.186304  ORF g.186304 m.186304 type:complete len:79 (+) comp53559_c0_seq7:443-679(+)